ncbi:MAG: tRNA (adenosine(37)-N6)-threonylcarbamoyltransferase complex dimerization subunit type 1 TsaB [Firmicutes bacterium]|nr:tRNA (adenosine(37)-N6)-threonylcarbamoyltransferase complex dimerization subunit type 1 TsaB [Bacillota bacterium]
MVTLGVDTSAGTVSAALEEDGALLGESFVRGKQQHSAVLLPMIDTLLRHCGLSIGKVGRFAVTCGPGSFTGVRIGVAAVKGLAQANDKPCAGVSTLAAIAAQSAFLDGVLCCAMDARRAQVYAALFEAGQGSPLRLCGDEALPIEALERRLLDLNRPVTFLGDGAALCHEAMRKRPDWKLAPEQWRFQRAYGAVLAAREADYRPAAQLHAVYLRPSQAERERKELIL